MAQLKQRGEWGVAYEQLAERLTEMGIQERNASVASRLSWGGFSAAFFLASMKAIGCVSTRIGDI